jgi:type I restriction enzyme S subunit
MSDWSESTIGELPLKIGDGNYSSKYPTTKEFIHFGIPFISNKDIKNGKISSSNLRYISAEKHAELKKGHIKTNDILVSTRANIGDIAIVDSAFEDANINAQLVFLRCDEKIIHSKFLYHLLSSKLYHDTFQNHASGTAQMQLPLAALREISIVYPGINKQKVIASVLSSLDDKIDLLQRQNKMLEAMAETLFRQWFVEEANDDWDIAPLGSLFDISSGKGLKKEQLNDLGLHCVLGANGEIGKTNDFLFNEQLIFTGRVGTLGNIFIVNNEKVWLSDNTLIFRNIKFFYFVYFSLKKSGLAGYNVGSTQPLIRQSDIKAIEILLPRNLENLNKFEVEAEQFFAKLNANNKQIQTLDKLRDKLLPKLMSGEVKIFND